MASLVYCPVSKHQRISASCFSRQLSKHVKFRHTPASSITDGSTLLLEPRRCCLDATTLLKSTANKQGFVCWCAHHIPLQARTVQRKSAFLHGHHSGPSESLQTSGTDQAVAQHTLEVNWAPHCCLRRDRMLRSCSSLELRSFSSRRASFLR